MALSTLLQTVVTSLNVWSVISLVSCSYILTTIHQDFTMKPKTKKAIGITTICVILIAIIDNISYLLYWKEGTEFIIKVLYTLMFIIIQLAPFIFLSLLEKGFFTSTKGMIVGMMSGANIAAMLLNLYYPVLFTITDNQEYVRYSFYFIRPLFITYTYQIIFGDVFRTKYSITNAEKILINQIALIFLVGFIFYDIEYAGELISALLGMGLHFITQIFHMLELKTDSVTGLPNRYTYNSKAMSLEKAKNLTVVSIDLNDLKKVNDTLTHDEGDKYLRANAMTLHDALNTYGTLYRTGGDEFIFIGKNHEEIVHTLEELQKIKNVKPEYGQFNLSFAFGAVEKKEDEDVFKAANRADKKMYVNKLLVKTARA